MQNNPRNAINFRHLFSCLINKVTLRFAHELEKSCETLVPHVPSWSFVSQLDKCLKFQSIRGDKKDCTPCKITPEMP